MTLAELLSSARRRLSDDTQPYLWSDTDIVEYLNAAINWACEEGQLIIDSKTVAICNIAVLDHDTSRDYALDSRILEVKSARMNSQSTPLVKRTCAWMDINRPDWRTTTETGTPTIYVLDYSDGYISIHPQSDSDDTILLSVLRLPVNPMTLVASGTPVVGGPTASPETPSRYHIDLIDGIMSFAYLKEDTETLDPKKAETHRQRFKLAINKMAMNKLRSNYVSHSAGPHPGAV